MILIQGDFGATYYLVNFSKQIGLKPMYSTTIREANEVCDSSGSIRLTHKIKHVRFREYEGCNLLQTI